MQRITTHACALLFAAACGSSHGTDAGGPASSYGDPCGASMPCGSGLSCVENDLFPGGYCTTTCDVAGCGDGASCDTSISPALCLASCADASECRDGYQCWRGSCRPRCRAASECGAELVTCEPDGTCAGVECVSDGDCAPTQTCRMGACVERPPAPDGGAMGAPPGTPCTRDDECDGRVCLPAALGGVCSLECTQPEDCFVFPSEAGCSALAEAGAPTVCVVGPPGGRGVGQPCGADDDCLARICQDGQCSEVCSATDQCLPGTRCVELARAGAGGATFSGCGYPDAGRSEIYEVDYGRVDVRAGFAEMLELATPADAISVTLQAAQTRGDARDLSFLSVTDPDGLQLFDVGQIVMLADQPIRWLPAETYDSASMLIPNTTPDRVTFVPGVHRWAVGPIPSAMGDVATPTLHLTALVKRARGGSFTTGRIDLNVFVIGISGLTAASAASHSKLQGALTRFEAILAPTGISLGTVRYFDVTGADATTFQVIDSSDGADSELARLFRVGSGGSARGVNVYLVRSISGAGDGFRALGVAGGIPGPVGIDGTGHSGVCVSFSDAVVGSGTTGANVVGQILAHEVGHYVGLFHATEQLRPCGPGEDPSDGCAPFGGGDQLADTTRGDDGNLMYWSIVGGGTNTELSDGQGHVYRMSALTR